MKKTKVDMEPVSVHARVKTVSATADLCIEIIENQMTCVPPPGAKSDKGMTAGFTAIYDQGSTQSEVYENIARPMVSNLLHGRPGLLFNYGVTCSGKTYTMTGNEKAPGFLPRALETIFSSLENKQTEPFQVTPDEQNGFRLLKEAEFMARRLERRNDLVSTRLGQSRLGRLKDPTPNYQIDVGYTEELPKTFRYACFMSYMDIYNEQIYDLLEEPENRRGPRGNEPRPKRLRDHQARGVYADGIEIKEIRSLDDALSIYTKGLQKRRNAETSLNLTSSRSHAILTIYVVRVPINVHTGQVFEDQQADMTANTAMLHLVDLAGSERQKRTNAKGDQLKEAASINNSLMTLRRCIDLLRSNQKTGRSEPIPYRSSKITHLFKNFFEVLGGVKLVICINPQATEFEENCNVLQFAEAAQSIKCKRKEVVEVETEEELLYRAAQRELEQERMAQKLMNDTIASPWAPKEEYDYSPLPQLEYFDADEDRMLVALIDSVKRRIDARDAQQEESARNGRTFRKKLTHYERKNVEAIGKIRVLEPQLTKNEAEFEKLSRETKKIEKKNRALMETQRHYELDRKELTSELQAKSAVLRQTDAQKRRVELESKRKMDDHQRKVRLETERRIAETKSQTARELLVKDEKLSKLKGILDKTGTPMSRPRKPVMTPAMSARTDDSVMERPKLAPKPNKAKFQNLRSRTNSDSRIDDKPKTPLKAAASSTSNIKKDPRRDLADENRVSRSVKRFHGSLESIVNPRSITHRLSSSSLKRSKRGSKTELNPRNESTEMIQKRRSNSADGSRWLAHTPNDTVHTNTVLQPAISANKRVHIPSETDLKKSDKYLLTHQEQGENYELRTTLIKGEVVDTKMGGIQVKFTGKERLTTSDRIDERRGTKRLSDSEHESIDYDSDFTDIATRCNLAVVHEKGADTAHVTNVSKRTKL